MKYKEVVIAEDVNKKRLKELNLKRKGEQKLSPAEQEEAIERILDHLGL